MLTLWTWQAVLCAWLFTGAGLGLGIALVLWWQSVRRADRPWDRPSRAWEQDRHGSAADGTLTRMRFMPLDRGRGADDE